MFKKMRWRVLGVIGLILLTIIWVLLDAHPALAQDNTVNYTYGQLQNQDFSHKDLKSAVLAAADMRGANFEGSDLSFAILTEGILLNANLHRANLSNALIDRVTLDFADLRDANFTNAIASRTRFYDTNITGADFTDAIIDTYQVYLLCERAAGVNSVTGVSTRDSLGCR